AALAPRAPSRAHRLASRRRVAQAVGRDRRPDVAGRAGRRDQADGGQPGRPGGGHGLAPDQLYRFEPFTDPAVGAPSGLRTVHTSRRLPSSHDDFWGTISTWRSCDWSTGTPTCTW